jgi:ATP-dependent RNA helicase DeaD
MNDFLSLGLPQPLLDALKRINFNTPTPIQAQAIPPALEGKDILGSAQTGTGKTGAFGIPLVAKLLASPRGSALVMTPTRELAMQVIEMIDKLASGPYSTIKSVLLIGGESMPKQIQQLRSRPRLIVGTPGRINDHLERGSLMLHDANFLVLDETDRMLDMGFEVQIERVVKFLPLERQTLLFSATLPDNIVKLSSKYLKNPVRVSVGSTTSPIAKIKQEIIHTSEDQKYQVLLSELAKRTGSVIMFVKTKWGAEKMAARLRKEKHTVEAIHGDLRQNRREKVIDGFRDYKYRILVATDIAARGLDIPHIEHVINYDLPQAPEDYIHRIGRTGRAGAEGSALCLITSADDIKWRAIQRLVNPNEKLPPRSQQGFGQGQPHRGSDQRPGAGSSKNRRRRPFRGGKPGHRQPQKSAA